MPPQIHVHPDPQNGSSFGTRVFAAVINVRMEIRSWQIRVGPKSKESVLIKRHSEDTQRHREEGYVKKDSELGVTGLQAKRCQ